MKVSFEKAREILQAGDVLGLPTETVYGLAARIDSESAIRKIFSVKERPFFDPLIVHVSSILQAQSVVSGWPKIAQCLAEKFWPGPLTLILPKSEDVSGLITSGLQNVGVRMPNHPLALHLIDELGVPVAAPSANKFGRVSPTQASHVEEEFFAEDVPVLDGGPCQVGLESTVLLIRPGDVPEISVLREGQILLSQIELHLQSQAIAYISSKSVSRAESPGHLKHHYMPSVPLILCQRIPSCEEHLRAAISLKIKDLPDQVEGVRLRKPSSLENLRELSLSRDPVQAAREFYQQLRELAKQGPDIIYFVEPTFFNEEPWSALRDRINKAASLILNVELA